MSSTYDSAQASKSNGVYTFSSTSTEKVAQYEQVYRWDYSPSVLLSSSSPAENESSKAPQPHYSEVEPELTLSCNHRLNRPPSVPPLTSPRPRTLTPVAIQSTSALNYFTKLSQDVRSSVNTSAASYNPSTASRTGLQPVHLERHLSSSTPSHHDSIGQSQQPPSQVYSDLAAHYGIPQSLPKPPRRTTTTQPPSSPQPFPDFDSLRLNYLNMLSQTPTDNSATMPENTTASSTVDPAAMSALVLPQKENEDVLSNLDSVVETMLASPAFQMSSTFEDYLTSPLNNGTPYDDFNTSPMDDSPFTPDLNTPIMADISDDFGLFNSDYSGLPLFNDAASAWYQQIPAAEESEAAKEPEKVPDLLNSDKLYTISPGTPALDSFKSASLYPSPRVPTSAPFAPPPLPSATTTAARRRTTATGTRKNITPESLVPLDAPTQSRKYLTPSATSRKEVPAVFAKKRSRSQAFDEEDELADDVLPPNATEREQIEWKRRQNTLAARKSRKRKLEHQQFLENKVEELTRENEIWKTRTRTLEQILQSHGVPFRPFED